MDGMYCLSGWGADYYHWWQRRTQKYPLRWEVGLGFGGLILTFLPVLVGNWGFAIWPLGWLCLPGLLAADRHRRHAAKIKADQISGAVRTKKLISFGRTETRK
tara:strand:- start:76 stop:384 length:309 start_codon:yes stop_codon:yes gene_type:complete